MGASFMRGTMSIWVRAMAIVSLSVASGCTSKVSADAEKSRRTATVAGTVEKDGNASLYDGDLFGSVLGLDASFVEGPAANAELQVMKYVSYSEKPTRLAISKTDASGRFSILVTDLSPNDVIILVARSSDGVSIGQSILEVKAFMSLTGNAGSLLHLDASIKPITSLAVAVLLKNKVDWTKLGGKSLTSVVGDMVTNISNMPTDVLKMPVDSAMTAIDADEKVTSVIASLPVVSVAASTSAGQNAVLENIKSIGHDDDKGSGNGDKASASGSGDKAGASGSSDKASGSSDKASGSGDKDNKGSGSNATGSNDDKPLPVAALPGQPAAAVLTAGAVTQLSINWAAGTGTTVGHVLAWQVGAVAPVNCTSGTVVSAAVIQGATSYVLTGLAADTAYSARICSVNQDGALSSGVTLTAHTKQAAPIEPASPAAAPASTSAVNLSWATGGGSTTGFVGAWAVGPTPPANCQSGNLISAAAIGSATTFQVTGLAAGTQYSFRICSSNGNTPPDVSAGVTISATTAANPPGEPSSVVAAAATTATLSASWTSGTGTTVGHKLSWVAGATPPADCSSGTVVSAPTLGAATTYSLTGLAADTQYSIRVCSVNVDGVVSSGTTSTLRTTQLVPNNPTISGATVDSSSAITVSWTTGAGSTVGYKLAWAASGTAPATCQTGNVVAAATIAGATSYQVTGLASNTLHSFRICAVNSNSPVDVSSGVTTSATTSSPAMGEPSSLSVTAASTTELSVTWNAGTGGTVGHKLAWRSGGTAPVDCASDNVVSAATLGAATSYAITPLSINTQYSVRICAVAGDGTVSPGATASGRTRQTPPGDTSNPSAVAASSAAVDLSWTVGNGTATASRIAYLQGGTAPASCSTGTVIPSATVGSAASYRVSGLLASTTYSFRICAVNAGTPVDESTGVTASATTTAHTMVCDSGTLDDTCVITSAKSIADGTVIAGAGTLQIDAGGSLTTNRAESFSLDLGGDLIVNGVIHGSISSGKARDITVGATGSIDASGLGYAGATSDAGTGPGAGVRGAIYSASGASHGGLAGTSAGSATVANLYGSMLAPTTYGSGGGSGWGVWGGHGGGRVKLIASGTLTISGYISVNGLNGGGASQESSGGGSGGSIWLKAGTLAGSGAVSANGGGGGTDTFDNVVRGGGGGGGRIVLNYDTLSHSGAVSAFGGATGFVPGGAGTIVHLAGAANPALVFDNNGVMANYAMLDLTDSMTLSHLTVKGCSLRMIGTQAMTIAAMTVNATGVVTAAGLGYAGGLTTAGQGPGAGQRAAFTGGGGSHAGRGGYSTSNADSLAGYGVIVGPTTQGSGGGGGWTSAPGGSGGGTIKFTVIGVLTVDGSINANGNPGIGDASDDVGGGGAGGSIWLTVGTLAGSGTVTASGGAGGVGATTASVKGGGGGGGHIAITYATLSFSGSVRAYGGSGGSGGMRGPGGSGTICYKAGSGGYVVVLDGGGATGRPTEVDLSEAVTLQSLTVTNAANLQPLNAQTMTISDLTITATGSMDVSMLGDLGNPTFGAGSGLGGGTEAIYVGSGASHGGVGGGGRYGSTSPAAFGSATAPITLGSGGAAGWGSSPGGNGGGAIKITVAGTLTNNGVIASNGGNSTASNGGDAGGGGAGGSLWLIVDDLVGSGTISATGGYGGTVPNDATIKGGGGAGGRIALEYGSMTLPLGNVSVAGGAGYQAGGVGSLALNGVVQP